MAESNDSIHTDSRPLVTQDRDQLGSNSGGRNERFPHQDRVGRGQIQQPELRPINLAIGHQRVERPVSGNQISKTAVRHQLSDSNSSTASSSMTTSGQSSTSSAGSFPFLNNLHETTKTVSKLSLGQSPKSKPSQFTGQKDASNQYSTYNSIILKNCVNVQTGHHNTMYVTTGNDTQFCESESESISENSTTSSESDSN